MSNFQEPWSVCALSEVDSAPLRRADLGPTLEYETDCEGRHFNLYLSESWQDYVWQNHPRQNAVMTEYKTACWKGRTSMLEESRQNFKLRQNDSKPVLSHLRLT